MKFESIKLEKSYRPIIYKAVELSDLVKGAES
jgi:double-strand break repair protein MRE11